MKKTTMRRALLLAMLLLSLMTAGMLPALTVNANQEQQSQQRIVKVGLLQYPLFLYQDEEGKYSGYAYEYLNDISERNGWKYEFVKGSWKELYSQFQEGKIDILPSAQYGADATDDVAFSKIPMGRCYGMICALDESCAFNDFKSLGNMKIGVIEGSNEIDEYRNRCNTAGITPKIQTYQTVEEQKKALEDGEIDGILMNSIQYEKQYHVLASFDYKDYFFMVKKQNQELLNQLDEAQQKIHENNPYYEDGLYNRYFLDVLSKGDYLDAEENQYLSTCGEIKVAVVDGVPPIHYFNEKGEAKGMPVDVMDRIAKYYGMKVSYVHAKTYHDAIDMVKNGEAQVWVACPNRYELRDELGLNFSTSFMTLYPLKVTNKDEVTKQHNPVYAVTEFQRDYEVTDKNAIFKVYSSSEECLEAVETGKADVAISNYYTIQYLMKKNDFSNLLFDDYEADGEAVSFAVSQNQDSRLLKILNKGINYIGKSGVQEIIYDNSAESTEVRVNSTSVSDDDSRITTITGAIGVFGVILLFIYIILRHKSDGEIYHLSYTDYITGCPNYARFRLDASKILKKKRKDNYALLYLDVQDFKFINDSFGHVNGDKLLREINKAFVKILSDGEVAARVSADHFVALIKYENKSDIQRKRMEIINSVMASSLDKEMLKTLIYKIGIYCLDPKDDNIDLVTDWAIYAEKTLPKEHKTKAVYFDDAMRQTLNREKQLEQDRVRALEEHEFIVYIQPKYDIEKERICGGEALCRWNHKERGFLNPGEFIPFFEKTGFVTKVDLYIFEELCKQMREMIDRNIMPMRISCNYSRKQLEDKNAPAKYETILKKYNIPPELIEIELTEEGAIADMDNVLYHAKKLKEIGFRLALDDFGSGYSSIQLIYMLPIDVVKFDKSIIDEIDENPLEREIMKEILEITKRHNISIIWEGVEQVEQKEYIKEMGGRYIQGYLYGKPISYEDFIIKYENTKQILTAESLKDE